MARPRKSSFSSNTNEIQSFITACSGIINSGVSKQEPAKKVNTNKISQRYYTENKRIIRTLNPGSKVEYSVQYASLDNNAVFVAARVINSLGYDFFNYKDIFMQDFLAQAGYTKHYTAKEEEYWRRASHIHGKKPLPQLKNNSGSKDYSGISSTEAAEYNTAMVKALYPILWKYCFENITAHIVECTGINQSELYDTYITDYGKWLFNRLETATEENKFFSVNTPIVICTDKINNNFYKRQSVSGYFEPSQFNSNLLLALSEEYMKICNLFEQLSISLIRDCCILINQIKINHEAGRDIMYPMYDTAPSIQQQHLDVVQEAINEMATTAEPEVLNSLSAGKIMPSFEKNPYAQVEAEYTDVEMDIVRYIMQDMIDAAKAV